MSTDETASLAARPRRPDRLYYHWPEPACQNYRGPFLYHLSTVTELPLVPGCVDSSSGLHITSASASRCRCCRRLRKTWDPSHSRDDDDADDGADDDADADTDAGLRSCREARLRTM